MLQRKICNKTTVNKKFRLKNLHRNKSVAGGLSIMINPLKKKNKIKQGKTHNKILFLIG